MVDAVAAMGFNVMTIMCWENSANLNEDIRSLIFKEKGGNNSR